MSHQQSLIADLQAPLRGLFSPRAKGPGGTRGRLPNAAAQSNDMVTVAHAAFGLAVWVVCSVRLAPPLCAAMTAAYFLLCVDSLLRQRTKQAREENLLVGLVMVAFMVTVAPEAFENTIRLAPQTVDGFLRKCDLALGLDGFALTRLCAQLPGGMQAVEAIYFLLPVATALAWIAGRRWKLLKTSVITAVVANLGYLACPAVGPAGSFYGWPAAKAGLLQWVAERPRNCMPSMHFTWTLLMAMNVPKKWKYPFAAFAVLTALSVVANGEHYFSDMLAALPFAVLMQWAL